MNRWWKRTLSIGFFLCATVAGVWSAERAWQTGTWRDVQVKRPKVVIGMSPGQPTSGVPRAATAATQEQRIYVIETDTLRLELIEKTTIDAPRLDAVIGQPVTFAIEKKTVYVKDSDGREHRLSVSRQAKK